MTAAAAAPAARPTGAAFTAGAHVVAALACALLAVGFAVASDGEPLAVPGALLLAGATIAVALGWRRVAPRIGPCAADVPVVLLAAPFVGLAAAVLTGGSGDFAMLGQASVGAGVTAVGAWIALAIAGFALLETQALPRRPFRQAGAVLLLTGAALGAIALFVALGGHDTPVADRVAVVAAAGLAAASHAAAARAFHRLSA